MAAKELSLVVIIKPLKFSAFTNHAAVFSCEPLIANAFIPPSRSKHVPLTQGSGSQSFESVKTKIDRYYNYVLLGSAAERSSQQLDQEGERSVFTTTLIAYLV